MSSGKIFRATIQKEVSEILKESIDYGLKHRKAGVEHSMPLARGLDLEGADRFIGMYVNDFTIDYGPTGRRRHSRVSREGWPARPHPGQSEPRVCRVTK